MYELRGLSQTAPNSILADDKAEIIIQSISRLSTHMSTYFVYQVFKRNLDELFKYIHNSQSTFEKEDLVEYNRLIANFLSSFGSFVDYYEKNYKDIFKPIVSYYYDSFFEYRFICQMRNYISHIDLSSYKIIKSISKNHIETKIIISKKKLLAWEKIKQCVKKEIMVRYAETDDIDIVPFLKIIKKIVLNIQIKALGVHSVSLLKAFKCIRNIVKKNEAYLYKDGILVTGLLNVLNRYYRSFAENFVYDEKLLSKKIVGKFFRDISFIYYGEKNMFYPSTNANDK